MNPVDTSRDFVDQPVTIEQAVSLLEDHVVDVT